MARHGAGRRTGWSVPRIVLVVLLLAGVLTAGAVIHTAATGDEPVCVGDVGFNWPSAGRVYVAGVPDRSVSPADPARAFTVAKQAGIAQVRVLVGVDAAIEAWRSDPSAAVAAVQRMVADAGDRGLQLVLSNYPDQAMIGALAGHPYDSWQAAQQDLTTPGSVPWEQFSAWLTAIVPPLALDPRVASWEVVNEPGYMLGIDNGTVDTDTGLGFVEHFAALLKDLGARTVNGGGRPVYDPMQLTDAQLAAYVADLDVLDDHMYATGDGAPGTATPASDTAADGRAAVEQAVRWFQRAREVSGRPDLPAMLGEVGSQPTAWFTGVLTAATEQGLPVLAWGFDAYDVNEFTDTLNPETLQLLTDAAARATDVNGSTPARVGTPRCRPDGGS